MLLVSSLIFILVIKFLSQFSASTKPRNKIVERKSHRLCKICCLFSLPLKIRVFVSIINEGEKMSRFFFLEFFILFLFL